MASEEHGSAFALSQNGDTTLAECFGLATTTWASAGAEHTSSAGESRKRAFMEMPDQSSGRAYTTCKIQLLLSLANHTTTRRVHADGEVL